MKELEKTYNPAAIEEPVCTRNGWTINISMPMQREERGKGRSPLPS